MKNSGRRFTHKASRTLLYALCACRVFSIIILFKAGVYALEEFVWLVVIVLLVGMILSLVGYAVVLLVGEFIRKIYHDGSDD